MFKKYMHIEKFGNQEVEGIELGEVHVYPKIDGTNSSAWLETDSGNLLSAVLGGSRNRLLSVESDNAGFYAWLSEQGNIQDCLIDNPNLRLYGEWLIPHTFTKYREDVWKKFYVFDVYNDETEQYLAFKDYKDILEAYNITFIAPLAIIKNGDYERFMGWLDRNLFLCPDGGEPGEGIVLKNYDYQNKFGHQCFAKIIRNEFKELHNHKMGAPEINGGLMNEEVLVTKLITSSLIDKTYAKIVNDVGGWNSKCIPRLLETVYHDAIKEELYDGLKEINFGTVNFKTLKALTIRKIKETRKDVF